MLISGNLHPNCKLITQLSRSTKWEIDYDPLESANVPAARLEAGSGHEGSSIEPYDNRTIDGETGTSVRSSARRGKQAILNVGEDLEFFTKLLPIPFVDGILRPCE